MNKQRILLYLWALFNLSASCFVSFLFSVYIGMSHIDKHNNSSAGDHAITERGIILSDIGFALAGAAFWIFILGAVSFGINQEMCASLDPHGRRIRNRLSLSGWRMFIVSLVILCLGPVLVSVAYYLERAPYFPQ